MQFKHRHKRRTMHMPEVDEHFPFQTLDLLEPWHHSTKKVKPIRIRVPGRAVSIPGYNPVACFDQDPLLPVWNRCLTLSAIFDHRELEHHELSKTQTPKQEQECESSPVQALMERVSEEKFSNDDVSESSTPEMVTEEPNETIDAAIKTEHELPSIDDGIIDSICATFEVVTKKRNCEPTLLSEEGRDLEWVWV